MEFLLFYRKGALLNLSHVATLQNEVKSCNLRGGYPLDWHSLVLVIYVRINGRGIMQKPTEKPTAQITHFEKNRNINKSIVFVSLMIHYFATCICSKLWNVMGKEALNLSSALRISPITYYQV